MISVGASQPGNSSRFSPKTVFGSPPCLGQGLSHRISSVRFVCTSSREKMLFFKSVAGVSFFIAIVSEIWAIPHPSITRERHVIHAPIKVRIIHHYKVQKVPIIIRKHLHYYKPQEEIHHHSQPLFEESHDNQISHDHDHQFEHHEEENRAKFKASFRHPNQDDQEEDYEESEQSQEEEYEDYEYE